MGIFYCTASSNLVGSTCTRTITNISSAAVYSCPAGQTLEGTGISSVCRALIGATHVYGCPAANGASFSESLKAGVIGGITGAAFAGVGSTWGAGSWQNYLGHAAVGCGSSLASGGGGEGCARGAASALIGKAVTNHTSGENWSDFTRGVAATVSGGVTSRVMGGSFASGAQTAAYGYLFNQLTTRGLREFFRSVSAAGHHFVPYVVSAESGVSMDAAREFSKSGTGIIPDYASTENPHRGHTKAHAEYDRAVRSQLDVYLKSNETTAANMTINQAKEFVQQIRTSSVPAIRDFNMAIRAHIVENALMLAPRRGD